MRLTLVSWSSFQVPQKETVGAAARERVTNRSLLSQALIAPETANPSGNSDLLEATINLLKVEARRIRGENTAAFPPLSVTRVPRDGSLVDIGFRSAASQGLPAGLNLRIDVQVLDVDSRVIALCVSALVGASLTKSQDGEMIVVYRGVFNPLGIAAALESFIYVAMDRAQAKTGVDPSEVLDLNELKVV